MPAFNLDFDRVLNLETGKTLTLTDKCNYNSNDEGYTVDSFTTREFIIKDHKGVVINTIPITADPIVITIDKDKWLEITMRLVLVTNTVLQKVVKKPCSRIAELELIRQTSQLCPTSCSQENKHNLRLAMNAIYTAKEFGIQGNAVSFQDNIDTANKFLKAKC